MSSISLTQRWKQKLSLTIYWKFMKLRLYCSKSILLIKAIAIFILSTFTIALALNSIYYQLKSWKLKNTNDMSKTIYSFFLKRVQKRNFCKKKQKINVYSFIQSFNVSSKEKLMTIVIIKEIWHWQIKHVNYHDLNHLSKLVDDVEFNDKKRAENQKKNLIARHAF